MEKTQSSITVRRALPDDLNAVAVLVEEAWTASNTELLPDITISKLLAENSIAGLVASRSQELWLAEEGEALLAVLGASTDGYIWACYVLPDHQRRGIGGLLLTAAEEHFRRQGLALLSLDIIEGNTAAQGFYCSKGWTEDSRRIEHLPDHTVTAIRYTFAL